MNKLSNFISTFIFFIGHSLAFGLVCLLLLLSSCTGKKSNEENNSTAAVQAPVVNTEVVNTEEIQQEEIQQEEIQQEEVKPEKPIGSEVGNMFVDFEAKYKGKIQKLSDYVGKGKYVLVDFWASWCGPCRREVPNIIKVYNKYKGDRFEVLGVATWDDPDETLQAVKEEGITYPQILNAQEVGSDAYGIDGIPEIILFGPDGTILERGLRGREIEKAVAEALAQ